MQAETAHVRKNSCDRESKQFDPKFTADNEFWMFVAWVTLKVAQQCLTSLVRPATALHTCILSFHINVSLHTKKGTTFLHKWSSAVFGLTDVLVVSSGARVHRSASFMSLYRGLPQLTVLYAEGSPGADCNANVSGISGIF